MRYMTNYSMRLNLKNPHIRYNMWKEARTYNEYTWIPVRNVNIWHTKTLLFRMRMFRQYKKNLQR